MQHRRRFTVLALPAAAFLLTACGGSSSSNTPQAAGSAASAGTASAAPTKRFHVIYLSVGVQNTYASAVATAAKAEAAKDNIDLTVLDGQFNPQTQSQQLSTAVSQKPDGIIVFPADSKAIIPATAAAKAAGIPVTFETQDIDPSGAQYRLAYSGPDNYTQGVHQFQLLVQGMKEMGGISGTPKIALIQSFAGSAANLERVKGFKAEMAKTGPKLDIVAEAFGDSDVTKSRAAAAQILTRFGSELSGIYAQDDNVAVGVAEAVKAVGKSQKITIVGNGFNTGAAAAIKAGTMYGTLDQSPKADGSTAVATMYAILSKQPYEKSTILPQPLITKKNVASFVAEW